MAKGLMPVVAIPCHRHPAKTAYLVSPRFQDPLLKVNRMVDMDEDTVENPHSLPEN